MKICKTSGEEKRNNKNKVRKLKEKKREKGR